MVTFHELDKGVKKFHLNSKNIFFEKAEGIFMKKTDEVFDLTISRNNCFFSAYVKNHLLFQEENGKELYIFNALDFETITFNGGYYLWRNIFSKNKIIFPNLKKYLCILNLSSMIIDELNFIFKLPIIMTDMIGIFKMENGNLLAYNLDEKQEMWSIEDFPFGFFDLHDGNGKKMEIHFTMAHDNVFLISFSINFMYYSICVDQFSGETLWLIKDVNIRLVDESKGIAFSFFKDNFLLLNIKTGQVVIYKYWVDRNSILDLSILPVSFYELSEDKIIITSRNSFPMQTYIFDYNGNLIKTINHNQKQLLSRARLLNGHLFIHYDEGQDKGMLSYYENIFGG